MSSFSNSLKDDIYYLKRERMLMLRVADMGILSTLPLKGDILTFFSDKYREAPI